MRLSAIVAIAEKYKENALVADRPVSYADAKVRPGVVTVLSRELAPDLSGWLGWDVSLSPKGKLKTPEPVTWYFPSMMEFINWAKDQTPAMLRHYLAEHGIKASGTSTIALAYRLTYLYEDALWHREDRPPLVPEKAAQRLKYINALDKIGIHARGVRDEDLLVKLRLYVDLNDQAVFRLKELNVTPKEKDGEGKQGHGEKVANAGAIRRRLEAEADAERGAGDEQPAEKPEKGEKAASSTASEVRAVQAGKGAKPKEKPPAQPSPPSGKATPPAAEREETPVTTATTKRGSAKKAVKAAAKRDGLIRGEATIKRHFPKEAKVKYIGRNKDYAGRTAVVTGYNGKYGVNIKFTDGDTLAVAPNSLELLKK